MACFLALHVLIKCYIFWMIFFSNCGWVVPRGILYGCGDLIFSSHMIFTLVFVRTYHKYGTIRQVWQVYRRGVFSSILSALHFLDIFVYYTWHLQDYQADFLDIICCSEPYNNSIPQALHSRHCSCLVSSHMLPGS